MNDLVVFRLHYFYKDTQYSLRLESRIYDDNLIVNKLLIGEAQLWILLHNQSCRFIKDMPLDKEIEHTIIRAVADHFSSNPFLKQNIATETSMYTSILLNAIANTSQLTV